MTQAQQAEATRPHPAQGPTDAVIAVTHRCNAQCSMCKVWQSTAADALTPADMRRLPRGLRTINLSGGEPFLRPDLPQFVDELRQRCPHAQITISTNAWMVDRILTAMEEIRFIDPSIRLAVSLDGLGEAHDNVRGVSGAFDAAMQLIGGLTEAGFRGLRLGMTLSSSNLDQLLDVAALAAEHDLELGVVAAHKARTHLGVSDLGDEQIPDWLVGAFAQLTQRWLRSWRPKQWLRAHFACFTYHYLAGRAWRVKCAAGRDFFFLQADGTVYHCSVDGRAMGNLCRQDWQTIWHGGDAHEARRAAAACPENCWMICTARSEYRRRPLAVLGWIALNKLRAHLRRLRLDGKD
ncbi:MAG: radical SAM/SPASM domain-containing protein [Planctomycetaceae bacterium]|nr:radical SAM protein [Planctomycetaceae bacterium]